MLEIKITFANPSENWHTIPYALFNWSNEHNLHRQINRCYGRVFYKNSSPEDKWIYILLKD